MHLLWLAPSSLNHQNALRLLQRLHAKGHFVTLGYLPSQRVHAEFFRTVDAAFPWIAPDWQLPQIQPDAVMISNEGDACGDAMQLSSAVPTLVFRIDHGASEREVMQWLSTLTPVNPVVPQDRSQAAPSFSVIIRTRNDAHVIGQTLKSLFSQTVEIPQVLVVNSSSTDGTLEVVKEYPVEVMTIPAEDYYPGPVLNRAVELTKGECVVFLNADAVLLTPRSIDQLLRRLELPGTAAVYARQLPRPEAEGWVKRDYTVAFPDVDLAPKWMSLSLCFSALKRRLWEEHHFYQLAWGSEDSEWGHWAKSVGWNIEYVSNALCMHSHNYTLRQLYGRRYIEGEADAFIKNVNYSWIRLCRDVIASSAKDMQFYLQARDYMGLLKIPFRRFVDHWGYYRGNRWGNYRKKNGIDDAKTGQQTVLKRYD